VGIGYLAGRTNQGFEAVAIGVNAGNNNQRTYGIAIGTQAGQNTQGNEALAIGYLAGNNNQGIQGVAIGFSAGRENQGISAVAIGVNAGYTNQGAYSVAIGTFAGNTNQGSNSVCIGAYSGCSYNNSIVINASGATTYAGQADGCFIRPLQSASTSNTVYYNTSTYELTYFTSRAIDKKNIVPINTTTNSENIYKLQPVEYIYKSDNTFNIGLIADDVAKVDSNLAVFDNEGKPMNIKWMDLQTYMLAEIQRLNKKVEFLSDILERNNIS
jgi:hypothetical protein